MDKTIQTRQNYPNKDKKIKDNGTNIVYFFSRSMSAFDLQTFELV